MKVERVTSTERRGLDTNAMAWMTPMLSAPWQWDDGGAALQWEDGGTLMMAEELALLADRFADEPMPPLTAILSLIAALKWHALDSIPADVADSLKAVVTSLSDLVRPIPAKHLLIETLLTGCAASDAPSGSSVAATLRLGWRPGLDDSLVMPQEKETSMALIARRLARISPEQLRLELETGLAALPKAAEGLPDSAGFSTSAFLEELERDVELAGLARLTRDIMAALTLPQMMQRGEDGLAGGVADISNRGPLHRLMLSELAHDDDTLAARVAMNEALYLQPEPPAKKPPGALVLLLDCGLRLWGLPRVFAASAALALALKARPLRSACAWRAKSSHWAEVNLVSADGLKAHMATLETSYDLTPALSALPDLLQKFPGRAEVVLCIHERTLADPSFAVRLVSLLSLCSPLHIVTVDAEGRLCLHQFGMAGLKLLHEAHLKLDRLLARPEGQSGSASAAQSLTTLPAVFGLKRLPFLISPACMPFTVVRTDAFGLTAHFGLNKRKEVWVKRTGQSGARRIPVPALRGSIIAFQGVDSNPFRIVASSWDQGSQTVEILVIGPEFEEDKSIHLWKATGFPHKPEALWFAQNCLYLYDGRIRIIRLVDGTEVELSEASQKPPQGWQCFSQGYFRAPAYNKFYRFHLIDGEAEYVALTKLNERKELLILIFQGHDKTPWAVRTDGSIITSEGQIVADPLPSNRRAVGARASADGRQVWIKTEVHELFYERNQVSGWNAYRVQDQSEWPFFVHRDVLVSWSMRTHFQSIGLTPEGQIGLCGTSGAWQYIRIQAKNLRLEQFEVSQRLAIRHFEHSTWNDEQHCHLRMVEWTNGSRAFLDDRGLLHLQSASPHIPEVTLALPNGMALSAWASDGHRIGVSKSSPADLQVIEGYIQRFVLEILQ